MAIEVAIDPSALKYDTRYRFVSPVMGEAIVEYLGCNSRGLMLVVVSGQLR